MSNFLEELHELINKYNNKNNEKDYILSRYVKDCVSINGILKVVENVAVKNFLTEKEDEKFFNSLP
jgi:hypothetical protein